MLLFPDISNKWKQGHGSNACAGAGVAFHACKGRGVIHLYRWSPQVGQLLGQRAEIDAHKVCRPACPAAHRPEQAVLMHFFRAVNGQVCLRCSGRKCW